MQDSDRSHNKLLYLRCGSGISQETTADPSLKQDTVKSRPLVLGENPFGDVNVSLHSWLKKYHIFSTASFLRIAYIMYV